MPLSDQDFAELRAEFRQALPGLIAGEPDRTDLMRSMERAKETLPGVREIVSAVSHESGVAFMAIIGDSTNSRITKARTAAVCLASELRPDLSQRRIADALNKDGSTVGKSLRRAEQLRMTDNEFGHWCARARRRLGYRA